MLMARFVNINTFSMHGMYRDRLIRAYLGASNLGRRASRFTGFAANDNIKMADLAPSGRAPFHVLNFALNLVGGNRLDWQQRKAESFTATPFHCGSRGVGYRPSSEYGGGITLGTAIAISGAAASPNMGYHSSSAVGAIMTLFNARQGCWLGNPGPAGAVTWRHPSPLRAVRLIVNEALGQTSDQSEYVYLSDGGHFENLAMYEMVRRRCRTIVVLDGGCDPEFRYDDLGDALRKIRIDMGIRIEFEDEQMRPLRARQRRCAVGTIRYSLVDGDVTDGRLIYVKAMLVGQREPGHPQLCRRQPDRFHTRRRAISGSTSRRPRATARSGCRRWTICATGGRAAHWMTCATTCRRRTSPERCRGPARAIDTALPGRQAAGGRHGQADAL